MIGKSIRPGFFWGIVWQRRTCRLRLIETWTRGWILKKIGYMNYFMIWRTKLALKIRYISLYMFASWSHALGVRTTFSTLSWVSWLYWIYWSESVSALYQQNIIQEALFYIFGWNKFTVTSRRQRPTMWQAFHNGGFHWELRGIVTAFRYQSRLLAWHELNKLLWRQESTFKVTHGRIQRNNRSLLALKECVRVGAKAGSEDGFGHWHVYIRPCPFSAWRKPGHRKNRPHLASSHRACTRYCMQLL